jgi:hypothetical protein
MSAHNEKIMNLVKEEFKNSANINACIEKGEFYTIVTPANIGFVVGSLETESGQLIPSIFESKEDAEVENKRLVDDYNDQMAQGIREQGDVWAGEVRIIQWDGSDEVKVLSVHGHIECVEMFDELSEDDYSMTP